MVEDTLPVPQTVIISQSNKKEVEGMDGGGGGGGGLGWDGEGSNRHINVGRGMNCNHR